MAHEFDSDRIKATLEFDPQWVAGVRAQWREAMDLVVWGDLGMTRLGSAPRLRKRVLELGERLKSLTASRNWIPHPREQLKSALAAALGVRETLNALEGLVPELVPSPDTARLAELLRILAETMESELPQRENAWARLLDAQLGD